MTTPAMASPLPVAPAQAAPSARIDRPIAAPIAIATVARIPAGRVAGVAVAAQQVEERDDRRDQEQRAADEPGAAAEPERVAVEDSPRREDHEDPHGRGDREHPRALDRCLADGAVVLLGGNEQEQRQVGDGAEPAEEHGDAEADPEDQGVDVEVLAEPAGDAAEHPVRARAQQAPLRAGLGLRLRGRLRLGHLVGGFLVTHRFFSLIVDDETRVARVARFVYWG